jgi:nucleoside-diphosphate-sugar epimerase
MKNTRRRVLMKKALVCGAGGFIGGHPSTALRTGRVKKLKKEGYWVRGVDIKEHEFAETQADEFLLLDLREPHNCWEALSVDGGTFDEVYQLAADTGERASSSLPRRMENIWAT